ncbi:glycerate kinase [Luteolibacter algae]|uniref:Glycerate kinase n=1 Tax=Luteolibacter algae TaxID=454151 RepID=A0ABW5DE72_9BACT
MFQTKGCLFSTFYPVSATKASVHIVIAPDKFKGSLTAIRAAESIKYGFSKVFRDATYDLLPLADGGEGILEAFHQAVPGKTMRSVVRDARGREVEAAWLFIEESAGLPSQAIIESSQANGLWRLSASERFPATASTYGVGQLIREAVLSGANRIIVGLGGSATNDAGIGLAAALGCRFLNSAGEEVEPIPANIDAMASIDASAMMTLPEIVVACDVANPLLGKRGATNVYGPQKGLLPGELKTAELGLSRIVDLVRTHLGNVYSEVPGAGAAGGLGFGLMTFCGAELESGFDSIAAALDAEGRISKADLVITAEGSLDSQTLEGKTPHRVSKLARKHDIPVYALAGKIEDDELLQEHFDGICSIMNSPMSLEKAMADAPELLEKAANRLAHILQSIR